MTGFYYKRLKEERRKNKKKGIKKEPFIPLEILPIKPLMSKYFYYRSIVGYNIAKCLNIKPTNIIKKDMCLNHNAYYDGIRGIKKYEIYNWDYLIRFQHKKKWHQNWIHFLKMASKVYDFSLLNQGMYYRYGIEFNFLPLDIFEYKSTIKEKTIDFLFFGHISGRRRKVINYLSQKYNVFCQNDIMDGKYLTVYQQIELIQKSKFVLSIQFFNIKPYGHANDGPRIMSTLSYGGSVIAEKSSEKWFDNKIRKLGAQVIEYKDFFKL